MEADSANATSDSRQAANNPVATARVLATLVQIEREARHASSEANFRFIVVNETRRLVDYDQAALWRKRDDGSIRIEAVSGVANISRETPFIRWLERTVTAYAGTAAASGTHLLTADSITTETARDWPDMVTGNVLWCPLLTPAGDLVGGLWLTRCSPAWQTSDQALLDRLVDAYTHAWLALANRNRAGTLQLTGRLAGRKRLVLLPLLLAILLLPLRQTALAPAEVIAYEPIMVTAPMEGVIREVHVVPNSAVQAGDLLFSLDDTAIRNRHEVALKAAEVAQADYLRAARKAFQDEDSKAGLAMLRAEVELRQAESRYTEELLDKIHIHAERNGIVIFTAANDWLGHPVLTGERVMTLADPVQTEIRLWLPIDDAINLEIGAAVTLFLNIAPTHPLHGTLRQTSYEAQVTPGGNLAYQLKATFSNDSDAPRIGLKGTGKIYGDRVLVIQYLLRRPFSAIRRYTGL
ncbi:MAG: HlyD family efflux transporter periplasmic adaptor subunit [Gammaproteobacteria bacterium]|nr:HlyD family efflux transporter periplasmic adaptor subunit [Gammaproteobacteria bacterium]